MLKSIGLFYITDQTGYGAASESAEMSLQTLLSPADSRCEGFLTVVSQVSFTLIEKGSVLRSVVVLLVCTQQNEFAKKNLDGVLTEGLIKSR